VRTNIVLHLAVSSFMSQISEKEDFTTFKWNFHCECDYREWEDELLARNRIKHVDYQVDARFLKTNPPSNVEARADAAKMILLKDYTLAMGIIFEMTSDLSRKMVHRITIPAVTLKELRNKYLEGKSDDDFVELVDMWENLKAIPK